MYLRLAFAVAAHLESEVVLVDEVLAVVDANFQTKVHGMQDVAGEGCADWGSTGLWSTEVHAAVAAYRFWPLEKAFQRRGPAEPWDELPVAVFMPEVKAGFAEQVAAMLNPTRRRRVALEESSVAPPAIWVGP